MEPSGFNAVPWNGRVAGFVYRVLFCENPTIEIFGKRFIVHNGNRVLGPHRAEASSLELTDVSLSTALILSGGYGDDSRGFGKTTQQQEQSAGDVGNIEGADD